MNSTAAVFATTHWSVVLAAGQRADAKAAAALEQLCRTYWYPLYAYVRRRGYGHEDAQDLTQAFLGQLLERESFARVEPAKGRFRSFLLAALNYFLADERDRARAQKRGGGQASISFVAQAAEQRYRLEPVDERLIGICFFDAAGVCLARGGHSRRKAAELSAAKCLVGLWGLAGGRPPAAKGGRSHQQGRSEG
ncbi:MAG: hypothetical protein FJ387_26330, partial [Verrucomicrobia bacterium]|nr:hypothetical protein [Verrucomicrobiota bacterium]